MLSLFVVILMLSVIKREQVLLPGEKNCPKKPVWPNKKSPILPKF